MRNKEKNEFKDETKEASGRVRKKLDNGPYQENERVDGWQRSTKVLMAATPLETPFSSFFLDSVPRTVSGFAAPENQIPAEGLEPVSRACNTVRGSSPT